MKFPFPDSAASWDITHSYEDIYVKNDVARHELLNDTIINEIRYSKLYNVLTAGFSRVSPCEYFFYNEPSETIDYMGAIRGDTTNRVYWIPPGSAKEYKIYNFSAGLNDSIHLENELGPVTVVVTGIDSVLIGKSYRKRLAINDNDYDYWIEGIGSEYGLYYPFYGNSIDIKSGLMCFKENSTSLYASHYDYDAEHCGIDFCSFETYFNVDVTPVFDKNHNIEIIPNPVTDISIMNYSDKFEFAMVYDMMGRHVKTYKFYGKSIELIKSDFNPGLYTIVVTGMDNLVCSQKLVVQ